MSMIRKYHNHKPQTNPWHRDDLDVYSIELQGSHVHCNIRYSNVQTIAVTRKIGVRCRMLGEERKKLDM